MQMYTRPELAELRRRLSAREGVVAADEVERLLVQAEYALDCAALLDEAVHFPADPYGEAEGLVAKLQLGLNAIWNRFHYR